MCGISNATIKRGKQVDNIGLFVGYAGGEIEIGDLKYADDSPKEARETMKDRLLKFTKPELVEMILQFVDNGKEG